MDGGSWGALKERKICVGGNHSYIMILGTKALSNSILTKEIIMILLVSEIFGSVDLFHHLSSLDY